MKVELTNAQIDALLKNPSVRDELIEKLVRERDGYKDKLNVLIKRSCDYFGIRDDADYYYRSFNKVLVSLDEKNIKPEDLVVNQAYDLMIKLAMQSCEENEEIQYVSRPKLVRVVENNATHNNKIRVLDLREKSEYDIVASNIVKALPYIDEPRLKHRNPEFPFEIFYSADKGVLDDYRNLYNLQKYFEENPVIDIRSQLSIGEMMATYTRLITYLLHHYDDDELAKICSDEAAEQLKNIRIIGLSEWVEVTPIKHKVTAYFTSWFKSKLHSLTVPNR